ncbi:MAG: glutamate-1-semialdehyde-2,1-aminomutase [Candidatus Omnitrophica bacterium CG23_combo_of_CG06-09_8_20_14_all_40_11]|nr:MAG: glutamate-1-semialdehyde-2,1-aminomutase [Candidatus Omnitrophica bacterium CG23_combo_of_CG06-09_8_20_14_all_40_11]
MAVLSIAKNLFEEAKKYIPGGVNSPVRSFKAVGGYPIFVKHANGSKIYGECGREFIDYCMSWGALILGHTHPKIVGALREAIRRGTSFGTVTKLETELAKLIVEAIPSIEKIRLTNSGTEAVMSAIRLARAYTKKDKIIKFAGAYHGHADYLLVKAGSGQATLGIPESFGVPKDFTKHTIVLPFNNLKKVKETAKKFQKDLAAIIVEPVQANCGVVLPDVDFLQGLRRVADRYGIILIFDEVITGFRLSYSGAQGCFGVKADLTCLGKIIGGGLPAGAFGGRREIMQYLAPEGSVYQAGTLSGNPIVVTAGISTLKLLKENNPYNDLQKKAEELSQYLELKAREYQIKIKVNHIGSMFSIFFTDKDVTDYKTALRQDLKLFKRFYHSLLKEGVYLSPSGFEANFLSTAHTQTDIKNTLMAAGKVIENLRVLVRRIRSTV